MSKLILDTHVCVWLEDAATRHRLSPVAQNALNGAQQIIIPGLVLLELHYLEVRRRIRSAKAVKDTLEDLGVQWSDASIATISQLACELTWTNDPFDRMICAEANFWRGMLLTADELIRKNLANALW